jgi:cell division protein FtsL
MVALKTRRPTAPPSVRRRRPRAKARLTGRRALTVGLTFIAVFGLGILYCAGYARMWKVDSEYRALQEEYRSLEKERQGLDQKLGELTSPLYIEQFANARGMVRAPGSFVTLTEPAPGSATTLASMTVTTPTAQH